MKREHFWTSDCLIAWLWCMLETATTTIVGTTSLQGITLTSEAKIPPHGRESKIQHLLLRAKVANPSLSMVER
jgi:hypothetical protein